MDETNPYNEQGVFYIHKDYGNNEEPLYAKAIELITGTNPAPKRAVQWSIHWMVKLISCPLSSVLDTTVCWCLPDTQNNECTQYSWKAGEDAAAKYLEQNGYTIRDRNWRKNHLELDIVADKDKELIIVEVKTRSNTDYIEPQDAVNWQKIRRIVVAADAYIKHFCLMHPSASTS